MSRRVKSGLYPFLAWSQLFLRLRRCPRVEGRGRCLQPRLIIRPVWNEAFSSPPPTQNAKAAVTNNRRATALSKKTRADFVVEFMGETV